MDNQNNPKQKKKILNTSLLGLAVVVFIGLAITVFIYVRNSSVGVCSSTASGSILMQSSNDLLNRDTAKLTPLISKIKSLHAYSKDPNCLYIISAYYLENQEAQQANSSLSQFNKVYASDKQVSPHLTSYASVTALRSRIDNLYQAYNFELNNVYTFPVVTQ